MLFVVACNKKSTTNYTISGKVGDEACKMLVIGLNNRFEKIDSIVTNEHGEFTYTIDEDTIVPLSLFLPDGKQITLFAEPGVKARLLYDSIRANHRAVIGGPVQALYDSISAVIEKYPNEKERIETIESFIKEHPINEINIELIRRYLIDIPNQDNSKARSMISKLSGVLQDYEYITLTKKKIESRSHSALHKLFPSFTYHEADSNKEITLNTFNKKHLLVTFWASWDSTSLQEIQKLREVKDSVNSINFEFLNIALDHDTTTWREIITQDSITGYNVCEKRAFNSEIASKFDINRLPYSIFVSPYQRIIKYGIDPLKEITLIDSLTNKYDKAQEERKKREEEERKKREKREKEKKKNKK